MRAHRDSTGEVEQHLHNVEMPVCFGSTFWYLFLPFSACH